MAPRTPSTAFKHFEVEAQDFRIQDLAGHPNRFEAKQRMLQRAEGFAVREAYMMNRWLLFRGSALSHYTDGIKKCEEQFAASDAKAVHATHPTQVDGDNERHRAEILLNLYARTMQHIIQRRLYTTAAVASVAAAIASVAAVVLTILTLVYPRG
jgi:hypothetical protein